MNVAKRRLNPPMRDGDYHLLQSATRMIMASVVPYLKSQQDPLVLLDVGCGYKPWYPLLSQWLKHYWGSEVVWVDTCDVVCMGEQLALADSSIDVVLSMFVLEHVQDPVKFVDEVGRVLRPGGKAFLTTHGFYPYHGTPPESDDYWRWTLPGLERLFVKSGRFKIVQVLPDGATTSRLFALAAHFVYAGMRPTSTSPLVRVIRGGIVTLINGFGELVRRATGESRRTLGASEFALSYLVEAECK